MEICCTSPVQRLVKLKIKTNSYEANSLSNGIDCFSPF